MQLPVYFGWQFASKAAKKLPDSAVRHYVNTLASGPDALHASFAIYRALDTTIAQNQQRPLGPRGGSRGGTRRADRVPGPVPGQARVVSAAGRFHVSGPRALGRVSWIFADGVAEPDLDRGDVNGASVDVVAFVGAHGH